MVNPAHAFFAELTTDPRTASLVGDRVMPARIATELDFPQIIYHRISAPRSYSHAGDDGTTSPRYQFDVWARDYDAADALAAALVDVLSGHSFGGITFITVIDERDGYEPDTGLYRRSLDARPYMEN